MSFALTLPALGDEPRGQARPRCTCRGGFATLYSDPGDKATIAAYRDAWLQAGRPRITGAFSLHLTAYYERPKAHLRVDGERLNAEGRRQPVPTRKPDLSNIVKLVEDALQDERVTKHRKVIRVDEYAWPDDALIVGVYAEKRWAEAPGRARVEVMARPLDPEVDLPPVLPAAAPAEELLDGIEDRVFP